MFLAGPDAKTPAELKAEMKTKGFGRIPKVSKVIGKGKDWDYGGRGAFLVRASRTWGYF